MADHSSIKVFSRPCATLLLACWAGLLAAIGGEWPTEAQAKRIVESVKAALPGCEITETARNVVPDGWFTQDPVGFLVRVRPPGGEWQPDPDGPAFQIGSVAIAIWFLPGDWVGLTLSEEFQRPCSGRQVRVGRECKAIVVSTEAFVSSLLARKLRLKKADLDGPAGAWWSAAALFGDRLPQALEAGRRLVEESFTNDQARIAAAESLCEVGVPATDILSEIASKGRDWDRQKAIYALGRVGTCAALRTLCDLVKDPALSGELRGSVARAMLDKADAACGPALLEALAVAESRADRIAQVLGKIRYRPAAPKLLELLANTGHHRCRNECARALAGMRYAPAVPVLRAILASPTRHRVDPSLWEDRRVGNALLQFTGPWGKPGRDVRLLIETQERVILARPVENWLTRQLRSLFGASAPPQPESPLQMRLYVENVGDRELFATDYLTGHFVMNGRPGKEQHPMETWIGNDSLDVNDVWDFGIEVPAALLGSGWNRIAYETHGTVSNEITVFVWTPSLVLLVGWAASLGALGAALAAMLGACRIPRWRLGLGGWRNEMAVAIAVSLAQAMLLVARVFVVPGVGWGAHALAFAVVIVAYKVTHRSAMRWRGIVPLALVQQSLAIGIVLLACVP